MTSVSMRKENIAESIQVRDNYLQPENIMQI